MRNYPTKSDLEILHRYRRFMCLKGNKQKVRYAIEAKHLTPGHDWGGWHRNIGGSIPSSTKDDMAFAYAKKDGTFIDGSLAILERELGTNWPSTDKSGLY